jgi:hypothetical protein
MRAQGHKPFHIVLLLTVALVSITYESAISADRKFAASSQTGEGPGPIPPDGPLARPKSLQQIGVPVEATRAAARADNPETPEKIALGEKIFFDGRLSVDGSGLLHSPGSRDSSGVSSDRVALLGGTIPASGIESGTVERHDL